MLNKIWNFIVKIFSYKNEKLEEAVKVVVDDLTQPQEVSVTVNEVAVKKKPTRKPKAAPKMKATKEAKTKKTSKKK